MSKGPRRVLPKPSILHSTYCPAFIYKTAAILSIVCMPRYIVKIKNRPGQQARGGFQVAIKAFC
ncbi:hypothetical protein PK28_03735 [Hymenobacter sp. DG25B]|nr:hypothetical protein PK28_03735 [Hymenobacter sp. DG25B]